MPKDYIKEFFNSSQYRAISDWMLDNHSWGVFKISELEEFFKLDYIKDEDIIKDKTIYCHFKNISQEKLRSSGFTIRRDIMASDLALFDGELFVKKIIEEDFFARRSYQGQIDGYILTPANELVSTTIQFIEKAEDNFTLKFIKPSQLYPKIYKYEGNKELAVQITELCESGVKDNLIIAMEMIANANWDNDPLYILEILSNYTTLFYMSCRNYFNSISFKGFTDYIQSKTESSIHSIKFTTPHDYKPYCLTEEHHQYIYNKFKHEFEQDVKNLCEQYKMVLLKFEVEIDKTKDEYDE